MKNVLVLDDEAMILRLLFVIVRNLGHNCITADDLEKAEQMLNEHQIHAIVSDGTLVKSGDAADWAYQQHLAGRKVAIHSAEPESARPGVPFLHKPASIAAIRTTVLELLKGS